MRRIRSVLKWLWVACSIGVLLIALDIYYDDTATEFGAFLFLLYGMALILCFPIGYLVFVVVGIIVVLIGMIIPLDITDGYLAIATIWLALFIAGYIQWFVLVPKLWRKLKARHEQAKSC